MARPMAMGNGLHVAYLTNQYPPNVTAGLGRYVEAMVPLLANQHCKILVCTLNPGTLPSREQGVRVEVVRPRLLLSLPGLRARTWNRTSPIGFAMLTAQVLASNLAYVAIVARRHLRRRLQVIVAHDSTNAIAAVALHRLLRLPVVFHVHTVEYTMQDNGTAADRLGILKRLERRLSNDAAAIVVPTPELREKLVLHGWDAERISVIPLSNPYSGLAIGERTEGVTPLVLFVGRFEAAKGVHELVDALGRVLIDNPRARFLLVGQGDVAAVRRHLAACHVADRGEIIDAFLPPERLLELYLAATVVVFPSRFEPFGLVALEAMATGAPVVLGPGFSRIFLGQPTEPAAVHVSSDPADIAGELDRLLNDAELRRRLGRSAADLAASFDWDATVAATVAVYTRVADDHDAAKAERRRATRFRQ